MKVILLSHNSDIHVFGNVLAFEECLTTNKAQAIDEKELTEIRAKQPNLISAGTINELPYFAIVKEVIGASMELLPQPPKALKV